MKKQHFMSLFIVAIMVLSVLGIAFNYSTEDSSEGKFKKYKFKIYNGQWITYKDDDKILISSTPNTLERIQVPDVTFEDLNSADKIYFTTNPNNQIPNNAILDIQANIFPKLSSIQLACIEDSTSCSSLPLKTCKDATPSNIIIQTQIADTQTLTFENNCLLIAGPRLDFTEMIDALILRLYDLKWKKELW